MFEAAFCERCVHDSIYRRTLRVEYACRIHTKMMCITAYDAEYPVELTHDYKGRPTCTAFEDEDRRRNRAPKEPNPLAPVQLTIDFEPAPVRVLEVH